MDFCLKLLGVPKVDLKSEISDLPLDKPTSLLYYLAQRGDWVSRSELAFLYRPDSPQEIALSNIRLYIHRVKKYPWTNPLEVEKFRVRYQINTDVQDFNKAIETEDWPKAIELYRGPFLQGINLQENFAYEAWLELERQDLSEKWRLATLKQAKLFENRQDYTLAKKLIESFLKANFLDEEALQNYLNILIAMGKHKQAFEAYETFREELKHELDIEPLEATRALLDNIERSKSIQLVSKSNLHNLPAQTTRFVGRKQELTQLTGYLANPDCRLLTIVGFGGIGKTRLALALAEQELQSFPDGVWLTSLVGLSSADLLVSSIAGGIGLTLLGSKDPKKQLIDFLQDKECLLLLDNFEHLVQGVPLLQELLDSTPKLKILVTSRVVLELKGEWIFDLDGLSYPPQNTEVPLEKFDAFKCFTQYAKQFSKTFTTNEDTSEAIAVLCRKVEGLPLALELAATWIRGLSISEMLSRLDKSFDLLSSKLHDLPQRHRSLRTVFDYSWQLLTEEEQKALTKLSVFQGGFSLEAAEKVAKAHLALLLSLINRSLIKRGQENRYSIHELIRQFAAEESEEKVRVQTRDLHSAYYLNRLNSLVKEDKSPPTLLMPDLDNLRSAWHSAAEQQNIEILSKSVEPMRIFYEANGQFHEGIELFGKVLEHVPTDQPQQQSLVGHVLISRACLQNWLGLYEQASEETKRGLGLVEPLGESTILILGLHTLGHIAFRTGKFASGKPHLERALLLARKNNNPLDIMKILATLGLVYTWLDQFPEANAVLEEAFNLSQQLNKHNVVFESLIALAILDIMSDSYESACERLEKGLEITHLQGFQTYQSHLLYNLGRALAGLGKYEEAKTCCKQALAIGKQTKDPLAQMWPCMFQGRIATAEGNFKGAEEHFARGFNIAWQANQIDFLLPSITYLAELRLEQNRTSEAAELLGLALQSASEIPLVKRWIQPALSKLQQDLDPDVLEDALKRGQTLSLEAVINDLLKSLPKHSPISS